MKFSRWIILVIFLVLVLSCKVVTFVHAGEEAVPPTEAKKAPETLAPPEIKKNYGSQGTDQACQAGRK